jgi:hypothetical protein
MPDMASAAQIAYNANVTKNKWVGDPDVLGSPLPGVIALPNWRVRIERRGSSVVLAWSVAKSPAAPGAVATGFVSLPRRVPPATLRRGIERLQNRNSGQLPTVEELLAQFRAAGGGIQLLRQIPPGAPPYFGGAGVLDDFIELADRTQNAIRAFAAHWGPLGICKHRVPWTHSLARRSPTSIEPVCAPLGVGASQGREGWEPLDKWREYSREAWAITREAMTLRNSRLRSEDRLALLFQRAGVWLELAAVPLVAYAEIDGKQAWPCGLQPAFAITGVFQILALQLLGVVGGGRELALCTHCGQCFLINGHREGNRRFCPTCVDKKIPPRYAARDYRARQHKR